jgi:hypothetical protein
MTSCNLIFRAARRRLALALALILLPVAARAYPEFQAFVVKHSGRPINCALCHTHKDGPEGTAPGQIGQLSPAELERLGRARAAFEPGTRVDSPILNPFGNHIIQQVGKKRFLEFRVAPEQLAAALASDSDLDHDGIPDAREYLDGTHPLNKSDGHPWLLFQTNVQRNMLPLLLALAATALGLYGLTHLLRGFDAATRAHGEDEE